MIFTHWSKAPEWRWPNFSPQELACRHCGQYFHDPIFLNRLQSARTYVGRPFKINSAHRCWRHNLNVGGAPKSEHKRLAVDIALMAHNSNELLGACRVAGFTGFGFYRTFLHLDLGRRRFWFAPGGRDIWT